MSRKDSPTVGGQLTAATFNSQLQYLEQLMQQDVTRVLLKHKLKLLADSIRNSSPTGIIQQRDAIVGLIEEAADVMAPPPHPVENHMVLSLAESVKTARYHNRNCLKPRHLKSTETP